MDKFCLLPCYTEICLLPGKGRVLSKLLLAVKRKSMLLQETIEKLKSDFPTIKFSTDEDHKTITIPAKNKNVGDIVIQDDSCELTIYVGNFTHWHASCYEESLNEQEKEKYIISEATEFLTDLFNDKIVMWGSNEDGGGFYNIEYDENEQDSPLDPNGVDKYVWSGKIS